MVAIGDVFSVASALVLICVTAWALIMGSALLFQSGASKARDSYCNAPWRGFFAGLATTAVVGIASVVLLAIPTPLTKLVGTMLYLLLMALAALGASGIALLISDRVAALDPNVSRYGALMRASSILVIAGVFPLLGWFLVGPVLTIASIGYGLQALVARQGSYVVAPPIERM